MPRPKNIIREQAKVAGEVRYYTGKQCPRGHIADRYTSSGKCVVCNNEDMKKRYATNEQYREYVISLARKQHTRDGTKWYRENKERAAELNKAYRKANSVVIKKARDKYRKTHTAKILADCNKRNADKKNRTPLWADLRAIQAYYEEAIQLTQTTRIPHHVDHIVPLVGELVSGLHCEDNLQVIPAKANLRKNNKFEV